MTAPVPGALGLQIQKVSALGYALAGSVLGTVYNQYRPSGSNSVITPGNLIGTIVAGFPVDPKTKYAKPSDDTKPNRFGLFDTTLTLPGDYLAGQEGVFFVASLEPNVAPQCVYCNAVVSLVRPGSPTPGSAYYGGDQASSESPLLTRWPASVLPDKKLGAPDVRLPGDTALMTAMILLPPNVPVQLLTDDLVTDAAFPKPNRYSTYSASSSSSGWRLLVRQAAG